MDIEYSVLDIGYSIYIFLCVPCVLLRLINLVAAMLPQVFCVLCGRFLVVSRINMLATGDCDEKISYRITEF